MPSTALPEVMLRSAGSVEPIWLLEALRMRMPSPLLGKVPLGVRVAPVGSTPMKLPRMKLPLLWTTMPWPGKSAMSSPLTVLPALPAPRVKPSVPAPAPVPSTWIRMTALSALASVLAEAPACE